MAEKNLIPTAEEILPEYEAPQALNLDDVRAGSGNPLGYCTDGIGAASCFGGSESL